VIGGADPGKVGNNHRNWKHMVNDAVVIVLVIFRSRNNSNKSVAGSYFLR
jgi:hypothetical protein